MAFAPQKNGTEKGVMFLSSSKKLEKYNLPSFASALECSSRM